MGNRAPYVNPTNADIHLVTNGSDWLWAVFSFMATSLLIAMVLYLMRPRGSRVFHQTTIVILTTMSIAYFSMASDLGATPVRVEFRKHGGMPTRQIWYVRYIMWFIAFPLLLLELLLATGLSLSDIFTTLFMGIILVITGLVGALVPSSYKWGYYVFGLVALFYIWHVLLYHGPRSEFLRLSTLVTLRRGYILGASWLSFLLVLYPICWALSEGGNVISPTSEMVFYGILDLLAGPILLFVILFHVGSVEYEAFGFQSGKYTDALIANKVAAPVHVAPGVGAPAGVRVNGVNGTPAPVQTQMATGAGAGNGAAVTQA